jgi:hypothetical protein
MGRTLPSITQAFLNEQQSLTRFRRALRLEDQRALDDLLGSSRRHLAAAAYASHLLPFEVMLLSMLVEEHKQVLRLQQELGVLKTRVNAFVNPEDQADDDAGGEAHEFTPQDEQDESAAGHVDEPPLRSNDRHRDPGGHL